MIRPVKKVPRKSIYVLAIKRCAEVATSVFHERWLTARVLEERYVPHAALALGDREMFQGS